MGTGTSSKPRSFARGPAKDPARGWPVSGARAKSAPDPRAAWSTFATCPWTRVRIFYSPDIDVCI